MNDQPMTDQKYHTDKCKIIIKFLFTITVINNNFFNQNLKRIHMISKQIKMKEH